MGKNEFRKKVRHRLIGLIHEFTENRTGAKPLLSVPVLFFFLALITACSLPGNQGAANSPAAGDLTDLEDTPAASPPFETVAAPIFTPDAGYYTSAQTISVSSATEGARIYVTTDGSEPTAASPAYTGPITLAGSATLKAIAVKDGMTGSGVTEATYAMDEDSPVVSITGVAEGAVVIGDCSLSAEASDTGEFDRLTLYINGVKVDETASPSVTCSWDTTLVENGSYTIKAEARDRIGNTAVDTVSVTVMNSSGDGVPLEYGDPGFDSGAVRDISLFVDSDNVPWAAYARIGEPDSGKGVLVKYTSGGWEPAGGGNFCAPGETGDDTGGLRLLVKNGEPFVLFRNNSGIFRVVTWDGLSWVQA
ncbi:MAG: hypothetical protein E4H36_10895, partial [Spirochaetales bacterium]